MTSATFIFKNKNKELIINVTHDGHANGLFSSPLFKMLKKTKNPSFFKCVETLNKFSDPEEPILIMKDFNTASYTDLTYKIDLYKRIWKIDGYKSKTF